MKTYKITGYLEYVQGHLRTGRLVLELTEDEFKQFSKLDNYGKKQFIKEYGELVVDDFEVDDVGDVEEIKIKEE